MVAKYPKVFGNNFVYTLSVACIFSTLIYYTRIMQTGDKSVIGHMINIDQTLKKEGFTDDNIDKKLSDSFAFSYGIMERKYYQCVFTHSDLYLY
jgi:hypothetical protein